MKQFLRKTMFALVGSMMFGAPAMAQTTTVGATDNTTGWWTVFSDPITIAPEKTLTVTFVNHSSKAEVYTNWATILTKDVEWGTEGSEYLVMRADCYGWQYGQNTNGSGWFKVNYNNYDLNLDKAESVEAFKNNLDGATVVLTIKRNGATVYMTWDVTTADSKKFKQFFAMDCGDGTENIRTYLTVDRAHIVIKDTNITDCEPLTAATGTAVGDLGNATAWWTAFSDYYTIEKNGTTNIKFKNYTCKVLNHCNWVLIVANDKNRGDKDYAEYLALRSDHYGWGPKWNAANITSNYVWDTYLDEMDGALVDLLISREGGKVTIKADQLAATDKTTVRTETYTFTDDDIAEDNIRVFLVIEGGHLDLLPVTATVSSYGWATFSSDYALDFAKATEGLEAYMITGHEGNVVTLAKVTGTVPAGTGLLLKGTASATYNIPIVGNSDTDVSANLLKAGTGDAVSAESGKTTYVLGVNGGNAEFQKITTIPATVEKGKAYLVFNETISAPAMLFEGDITGISAIEIAGIAEDGIYYNLSGQRVAQPTKGLYIVNGKKVIVKK